MPNASTPNEQSNTDSYALLSAVEDGDAARVERLLAEGLRADAALRGGETLLMRASARGHEDVARVLLEAGADVNARRADGFTPLVLAVFFGHEEVVKLLIERGADVSAQTRLGTTAGSWAASRGFAGIAELLRRAESAKPRTVEKKRVASEPSREVVKAAAAESVRAATAVDTTVSNATFKTANAGMSNAVGVLEVFGDVTTSDDVAKFSRAASKSDAASEPPISDEASEPFVSVRREANAPAHPSARAFALGGFLRSWQGSVGTALLLIALGVTVFAVWNGRRQQRLSQQPAQAAQSPTPQTFVPDASIAVTQPSPLPSPTPDAQAVMSSTGVPPEAMYPVTPGASLPPQTFYVPPAASNAPSVPTVVSENGASPAEDASRSKRKSEAATNETANQPSQVEKRDAARNDDSSRSGSTDNSRSASPGRSTRAPVADSPSSSPATVRTSPPPAATPERRKVIQWPPQ